MTATELVVLAPYAVLGLGAVLALLAAPIVPARVVAVMAAITIALMLGLAAARGTGAFGVSQPMVGGTAATLLADDPLAVFGLAFSGLVGLAALSFIDAQRGEAAVLLMLCVLGGAVLAAARHAASLFLGLEIASLSLVALFAFALNPRSEEAAYKYLISGGIASAATLLGIAYLFAATGGLALSDWRTESGTVKAVGMALLLSGLALRLALVPLHAWTPDAFEGASPGALALSSALTKGVVALAILRISAEAVPGDGWSTGLSGLAALSILLGNLAALAQTRLDRMLGYSSIAHSGYLAMLLAAGGTIQTEAVIFYITAYSLAIIPAIGMLTVVGHDATLESIRSLLRRDRLGGAAMILALLSLAGLPVSAGFMAKVYLFAALADVGAWFRLALAIAGSAVGVIYCFRFMIAVIDRDQGPAAKVAASSLPLRLTFIATIGLTIALGLLPTGLVRIDGP